MDRGEILLVPVFHVLHIVLLHLLWHDGCGCYTKSPCCFNCGCCILWNLEPLFRICHYSTGKFCQPWNAFFFSMNGFNGCLYVDPHCYFDFCYLFSFMYNRTFLYGGGGTTGHVLWPGLYMGWLPHSLEI